MTGLTSRHACMGSFACFGACVLQGGLARNTGPLAPKVEFVMDGSKLVRQVTITNPQGMHARPADMFVKLANRFASQIVIVKGSERVDGKSILGLLTLAATEGTMLLLEADGPDAQQALDALAELVAQNFAEDEATRQ